MPDPPREMIVLHLRPLKDETPVPVRLRFVLKRILREEGFRCVKIEWRAMPEDFEDFLEES